MTASQRARDRIRLRAAMHRAAERARTTVRFDGKGYNVSRSPSGIGTSRRRRHR